MVAPEELFISEVKRIYEASTSESNSGGLSPSWCAALLEEDRDECDKNVNIEMLNDLLRLLSTSNLNNIEGADYNAIAFLRPALITRPFYRLLAKNIWFLINQKKTRIPAEFRVSKVHLLQREISSLKRMNYIEKFLEKHKIYWLSYFGGAKTYEIEECPRSLQIFLTEIISPQDLGLFFGLYETKGSIFSKADPFSDKFALPSLYECVASFCACHSYNKTQPLRKGVRPSVLTSGGRALAKHCHRDSTDTFWPNFSGSEEEKNKLANQTLANIVSDIAWTNLHFLPNKRQAYEIRNTLGYGARWEILNLENHTKTTLNGHRVIFRGLLEPQMENGHALGWRH